MPSASHSHRKHQKYTPAERARRRAEHRARGSTLSDKERGELLALETAFERALDRPVRELLHEAHVLEDAVKRYGGELLERAHLPDVLQGRVPGNLPARLNERFTELLSKRRSIVEQVERSWIGHRMTAIPEELRALREESEEITAGCMAALREVLHGDHAVLHELDDLEIGEGMADLVDDLRRLADLLEVHSGALSKVKKATLPEHAPTKLRQIAERVSVLAADHVRTHASETLDLDKLRNRAAWYLHDAMDEVRLAARYLLRGQPRLQRLFGVMAEGHEAEQPAA